MSDADEELMKIQKLQFSDKEAAEHMVCDWFERYLKLKVDSVRLVPKAVSLNSFNGFYTVDEEEYFFKTHVEEMGIGQEYYDAPVMHEAGYNIVLPLRSIQKYGQQMVIYPVIRWPEMFNLMRACETGNDTSNVTVEQLVAAERYECKRLLEIYDTTLKLSSAQENAQAKIYQLFWHRLAGERLQSFYMREQVPLPGQGRSSIPFADLLSYRWVVNGKSISVDGEQSMLGMLIERGKSVLNPERELWTVVGHGDAHFGNVFLEENKRYLYFDPAFAGHHSPLLDIVKPFFHNVFAMWMYFGSDVARELQISVALRDEMVYVEHNYNLPPIRQAMLETKQEQLLKPLIELMRKRGALPEDWRAILRSALLCCPLLTIDMLRRLPVSVCWLGLSQVMQMGTFEFDQYI